MNWDIRALAAVSFQHETEEPLTCASKVILSWMKEKQRDKAQGEIGLQEQCGHNRPQAINWLCLVYKDIGMKKSKHILKRFLPWLLRDCWWKWCLFIVNKLLTKQNEMHHQAHLVQMKNNWRIIRNKCFNFQEEWCSYQVCIFQCMIDATNMTESWFKLSSAAIQSCPTLVEWLLYVQFFVCK